jgi:SsrA-binding protein
MAKKKDQDAPKARGVRIENRKARHNYHMLEKIECGLALVGTEVKSLRAGQAKIDESYARLRGAELFLIGSNIATYPAGGALQHEPTRDRKLLIHKRQVLLLATHVKQKGKTLVPLAVYFRNGWAKCEIGVVIGKRQYDKRESIRKREQERETQRATGRRTRGGRD